MQKVNFEMMMNEPCDSQSENINPENYRQSALSCSMYMVTTYVYSFTL